MKYNYTLSRYLKGISSFTSKAEFEFSTTARYLSAALLMALAPAVNAQVNSNVSAINKSSNGTTDVVCDAVALPYTVPMSTAAVPGLPECIEIENVNNDDKIWGTQATTAGITGNIMRYGYSYDNAANDWFYTRKVNLTAGSSYRVTFKYKITGYQEKLKVAIGSSASATAMTQILEDITIPSSQNLAQSKVIDFTVAATGEYNVGFQAHSDANMNALYVGEISVTNTPTCLPVSGVVLTADSLTQTAFSFSWTASPTLPALGYDYEVRSSGDAGSGATGLGASGSVAAGVTTASVSGLNDSTVYKVYVKANCTASDSSVWIASGFITTLCGVATIPYTMPLESAVVPALPPCVTIENVNNDTKFWRTSANGNNITGIAGKVMEYPYSSSNAANDWFYTNSLSMTAGVSYRLTFKYAISGYEEKLKVAIGSSASAGDMTQVLVDLVIPANVNGAHLQTVDFTIPATGNYNVGFQAYSVPFQNSLYVGEVSVEVAPTCIAPSAITVDLTTVTQTAFTFSWTAPSSAPADGYEYEVRLSGEAGSGATGLAASGTTTSAVTTASVTDLVASTTYTVYVRAVCSDTDASSWTALTNVSTACGISNIPYELPLATAVEPGMPICVTSENLNNDTSFWKTIDSTDGMTGKVMQYTYNYSTAANDWFYTAPLNLTAGVTYQVVYKYKISNYEEKLKVAVGTSATASTMTQTIVDLTIPGNTSGVIPQTNDFTVATTGVYYVGFQAHSLANMNSLYVGEISVIADEAACVAPSDVAASAITINSATISWAAAATAPANGYKYEVRTSGEAGSGATGLAASGTTAAGVTTADITLLMSNTEYSVFVASVCAEANSSDWTAVSTFTTLCDAPVITAEHTQTITVDAMEDATLADLMPAGENVSWFATTEDAASNTNELLITTQLVSGTTYYAVLTENGCSSAPFDVTVTVALGLANQTMSGLSYYPNPVQNQLNINYSENITSIAVFNLVGQKVMTQTPNATNVVLDMSTLAAGTYMIQVNADTASKVIKLIKK